MLPNGRDGGFIMFDRSKPVLVYLGGGVQGAAAIRAATARGLRVRALTRAPVRSPGENGAVEWVRADLDDPVSLRAASEGIAHAVVQVPTDRPETMQDHARAALGALAAAGARSFVLRLASASRPRPHAEPSFVGNHLVEEEARRVGLAFAIVRPTLYLDNLLKPSALDEIAHDGVLAPPIAAEQPVAWTCVDDVAAATLILLERAAMGGDHRIAGSLSLTGDALADRLSANLGWRVRYCAQPVDAFERDVAGALGEAAAKRIASKFRYFGADPRETDVILGAPLAAAPALADFVPTDVGAWLTRYRAAFVRAREERAQPGSSSR
jgi:uncharacterized protein YbjT (DUF2867 family)